MKDRIPLYPGRVKLNPVSGQPNTFDLVRADQPTQEGTPLNKANLLKDATAALFGKTNAAVPDDILSLLSKSALAHIEEKYTKTTIGTIAVGKTITINVSGSPREFIIVNQGKPSDMYDASCNGTWLLMKDIYENRAWQSGNVNKYESSDIHTYLNNTFLDLFDSNIKDAIKQVKIPYRKNGGSGGTDQSGANGLPAKIFLLSGYEVGFTASDGSQFPVDGAKLSYFESGSGTSANNKRIANLNDSATNWWLRSQNTSKTNYVFFIYFSGSYGNNDSSNQYGIRPALILPPTFEVYSDSSGNCYTEQESDVKITDVLGNLIAIPADQIKDGVRIATGLYTGTGTYGASNPNSLTFEFEPKILIIITHGTSDPTDFISISGCPCVFSQHGHLTENVMYSANSITWWHELNAEYQANRSGIIYDYLVMG